MFRKNDDGRTKGTARKILLTSLVIGALTSLAGIETFSNFSSTTQNDSNVFAAGTVSIGDNDAGSAMYNVTNAAPLTSVQKCIKVTYTGSLAADVKLYTTSSIGAIGQYVNLTIETGTSSGSPTFPGCGTYTSEATIYSGTLANFGSTKNSYGNGVSAYPGSQTQWSQNDAVVYRFTLSLQDTNAAQGLSSGSHSFIWEARNQ